ncbi:unnamed protein product [Absidia cylindrospora]
MAVGTVGRDGMGPGWDKMPSLIIKSSLSSIMDFINPICKTIIMNQMGPSMCLQVENAKFGQTIAAGISVESSDVFDKMMAFGDGTDNTDAMLAYILTSMADLIQRSHKRSQVFQVLSVLEQIFDNIGLWHTEIELGEIGETVCTSTNWAIEINKAVFQMTDSSATYGRKIDLLLKYDGTDHVDWIGKNHHQCKNV